MSAAVCSAATRSSTGGNLFSTGGHAEGGQVAIPFPTLNTWTVSEWFQVTSAQTSNPSWTTLLGDWAEGGAGSFMRYVGPNTWNTGATGGFGVWLGDGSSWSGPGGGNGWAIPYTLTPDSWYNITETVGNGVVDLYLNGSLLASGGLVGTPVLVTPTASITIGYDDWLGWGSNGLTVDDLLIVNHAITASQVSFLYQGAVNTLPSASPVQMGAGVLDLAGINQTVASLADVIGGGTGTVTSSVAGAVTLTLAPPSASTTTFSGVIQDGSGTMALVMNGPGTQVLAGVNTYSGGTTIQQGVLSISNDYNLGNTSGAVAITSGTLQATGSVTLNPNRPLSVGPAAGIDIPSGSSLVIAGTITNAGASTGNLTVTGANGGGVLQLDGTASYSGMTTIAAGTLSGTGTLTGPVTIAAGATLAGGDNTANGFSGYFGTLTMGSLTLANNSSLNLNVTGLGGDQAAVSGILSLGTGLTLNVGTPSRYPTVQPGHSYTLITTTEGITEAAGNPFTVNGLPSGDEGIVVVSGSDLVLDVSAIDTWNGSVSRFWNTTQQNWTNSSNSGLYADGDAVVFDSTGIGTHNGHVVVGGAVAPAAVTFENFTATYTLAGSGTIWGATSLTMEASGQLNVNMANNTYSGGTNLQSGVLQIGADSMVSNGTLASGPLGVGPIGLSGGTLQDDGNGRTVLNAVTITGDVTLASAGTMGLTFGPSNVSGTLATPNTITIDGGPTITVLAPTTFADVVSGNLNVAGNSTLTLTAGTNGLTGTTTVDGGSLIGTAANIATPVALSNGGNVTYNQDPDGVLSYPVSGNGSLTKIGNAMLTVATVQSYQGATNVLAGTLQLGVGVNLTPVIRYTFDGPLGGTSTIADVSGNGHTGTLDNSAQLVAGQYNQAIQMTGNQTIMTPGTSALYNLTSWTDSVWINMAGSSLSSNNAYFLMSGRYNQPDAYGFDTWIQNGQIGAEIPEVGPGWLGGQWYFPVSLTADTWTMITQTITTGTYDLYIDGVLVGTKSLGAATPQMMHSPANFGVGRDSFVGLMDEFNLFSQRAHPGSGLAALQHAGG